MARKVRDKALDTRLAREKLAVSGKPYWRVIEPGLHLGYRRLKRRAGTWVARHYLGDQKYEVESIGLADDFSDADGVVVFDFWQAQAKARERMVARAHAAAGKTGPITVAEAMDEYLGFLAANRKTADDARYRYEAFIRAPFGGLEVGNLTSKQIRDWHTELAAAAPRLRTRKDEPQKFRPMADDGDGKRRRKASANRTLTVLKAALNRAWREGKVQSDAAWRRVEPFENVDAARIRYLTIAEAQRLMNASMREFRPLIQAALQTGARYGELTRLQVHDFNRDAGTLAIRESKAGKPRHVVLTDEGRAFFEGACIGRSGNEFIFLKANGEPWQKSHQMRPMVDACRCANIEPAIGFHGLRHTWASHAVMNGVPLLVVARNLGHADTRMVEKHYGHLAPSYVADAIRAGAPRFGIDKSNIEQIR